MTNESGAELDFKKAEFENAGEGLQCSACATRITDRYFQVNGQVLCPECREGLNALSRPEGKLGRIFRATVFGMIGGAIGAAVWYAILALFDYQLGLIALMVGWLVGTGVSRGSGGRGGIGYQVLAAFIAYASIVTTYIPYIFEEWRKAPQGETVESSTPGNGSAPAGPATAPAATPTAVSEPAKPAEAPPLGLVGSIAALGLGILIVYGIAFAAPFFGGLENAIGILIIFFALHQAWTLNRKPTLDIQGPFRLKAPVRPPANSDNP